MSGGAARSPGMQPAPAQRHDQQYEHADDQHFGRSVASVWRNAEQTLNKIHGDLPNSRDSLMISAFSRRRSRLYASFHLRHGTCNPHAPRLRVAQISMRSCLWNSRSVAMALGRPFEKLAHEDPKFSVS